MKAEILAIFDDLDARAPRILDEAQLEKTRDVSRRGHDLDSRGLECLHLRGEIGERESDVIDTRTLAPCIGLPVREDQLSRADLTGIGARHGRAADVRDVPLNSFGHVRRGEVNVVIVGGASDTRKCHEQGGQREKTETMRPHEWVRLQISRFGYV